MLKFQNRNRLDDNRIRRYEEQGASDIGKIAISPSLLHYYLLHHHGRVHIKMALEDFFQELV